MVYEHRLRWDALRSLQKDLDLSFRPKEHSRMSSYGFKQSLRNGYSHHSRLSLATLEYPVTAGQSCQTKSGRLRWGKCQGPGLRHSSASVRERLRECSFVANLHQTHTPLPSKKRALEVPTRFTGQRNCGEPVGVVEQQSDSVIEPLTSVLHTEASQCTFDKRNRLKNSCRTSPHPGSVDSAKQSFPKSMGHVAETADGPRAMHDVIFSTEVPHNSTNCQKSCSHSEHTRRNSQNVPDAGSQGLSAETSTLGAKKPNCVLQDQIRRVVVNLEEVLRGLKEVELEMKEVVIQIDKLTSDIDLGEEDTGGTSGGCSFSRRESALEKHTDTEIRRVRNIAVNPNSPRCDPSPVPWGTIKLQAPREPRPTDTHRGPPPAYPTSHSGLNGLVPKSDHGASASQSGRPKSEATAGPRSRKPPPYPLSSRARRPKKGKELEAQPLPDAGRRTLLSTTV